MISLTIKNPKSFSERVRESFGFPRAHTPNVLQHHPRVEQSNGVNKWSKIVYANWIEGVKAHFKKGQIVTLKAIDPRPGTIPHLLIIEDIHEIHHLVDWDRMSNLPKAIRVKSHLNPSCFDATPDRLRILTGEELNLVRLKNMQPQGTA